MRPPPSSSSEQRLSHIGAARQAMLVEGRALNAPLSAPWIQGSWQRCLTMGFRPQEHPSFDMVAKEALQRIEEANHTLLSVARPLLGRLGQAIADTRYFAILTNAEGIVVDVSGNIDRSDPRADVIARVGVDLSERRVGTTAIGAALTELRPVWLHRGEHFFDANSAYSCAGAPLFGPDGACVGMLDLTGVDAMERPELRHLVARTASKIENALVMAKPHCLLVRLNWPGYALGSEGDGMLCLDGDGWVTAANTTATTMLANPASLRDMPLHANDVFGFSHHLLFDAAKRAETLPDVPLRSGLHVQAMPVYSADELLTSSARSNRAGTPLALKDMETALIRKAVEQSRGNVSVAAKSLGISRATVYRKLGRPS
ncbi:helix-turn-helix domain-containing protein [Rhodoferax sp. OV413]|uniref:helix-turn-helix domain-containing protein n=1 Tax=Rhodoferax sp. OV413 TaxID=1855285 RepID=UPI0025EB6636|nr:helix-turn-helix domain-containing protein [Rhodoferax sp. OV413]